MPSLGVRSPWVLGFVRLIDTKSIDVAQPTFRETVRHKLKIRQKIIFWAYARRPYKHIDEAISMPFTSINHTKEQSMKFSQKNIENRLSWKMAFLAGGHFEL